MIEIKDLTKGQVVYECEAGRNLEITIASKPRRTNDGWSVRCKNKNGDEAELFVADGSQAYGPKLYDRPQYAIVSEKSWKTVVD